MKLEPPSLLIINQLDVPWDSEDEFIVIIDGLMDIVVGWLAKMSFFNMSSPLFLYKFKILLDLVLKAKGIKRGEFLNFKNY